MIYSYIRVSSKDQNLDRQIEAVKKYRSELKNENIFADKQSGKNFNRANYTRLKSVLSSGDELIIKELDRLGRNKQEVKKELEWFKAHAIIVRILDVPTTLLDFKDQKWVFDMVNNILIEVMASVAEEERVKIHERQREGIAAAKAKGRHWGHCRMIPAGYAEYRRRVDKGELTVAQAVKELGISRRTWYNLKAV